MIRTDEDFDRLLLGLEAFEILADERFATPELRMQNGQQLIELLRDQFKLKTSAEWLKLLKDEQGLPIERVTEFGDLRDDEHLMLNRMVTKPVDDIGIDRVINDPVNVDGVARVGVRRAPDIGEHTDDVLTELGFDQATIEALKADGVVG